MVMEHLNISGLRTQQAALGRQLARLPHVMSCQDRATI